MRPPEYLALKWGDIDLERRTAIVHRSLDFLPGPAGQFARNKTGRSRRTIRLHAGVCLTLARHKLAVGEQRSRMGEAGTGLDLVFPTNVGARQWSAATPTAICGASLECCNEGLDDAARKLPRIRLSDLRHTAATLALAAGAPLKVVQEMPGDPAAGTGRRTGRRACALKARIDSGGYGGLRSYE